jgi:hypothetical protein
MSTYEIVIKTKGATLSRFLTCDSIVQTFDDLVNMIQKVDGWGKTVEAVTVTLIPEVNS